MKQEDLVLCLSRGIEPSDLLDFCRTRSISHQQGILNGKYWKIWKRGNRKGAVRVWAQTAYEAWSVASGRLGPESNFASCAFETDGKVTGNEPLPGADPKPTNGQRLFIYHDTKGPVEAKRQPDRSKLRQLGPINTSGVGHFMLYEEKLANGKPITWAVKIKDRDDEDS
jgi:hypothetical protein